MADDYSVLVIILPIVIIAALVALLIAVPLICRRYFSKAWHECFCYECCAGTVFCMECCRSMNCDDCCGPTVEDYGAGSGRPARGKHGKDGALHYEPGERYKPVQQAPGTYQPHGHFLQYPADYGERYPREYDNHRGVPAPPNVVHIYRTPDTEQDAGKRVQWSNGCASPPNEPTQPPQQTDRFPPANSTGLSDKEQSPPANDSGSIELDLPTYEREPDAARGTQAAGEHTPPPLGDYGRKRGAKAKAPPLVDYDVKSTGADWNYHQVTGMAASENTQHVRTTTRITTKRHTSSKIVKGCSKESDML